MGSVVGPSLRIERLRRIAGMSVAEIQYRGRQEGLKWIERLRSGAAPASSALLQHHAPVLSDTRAAIDSVRRNFDRCFFPGVNSGVLETLRRQPAFVDGVISEADRLVAGWFDLLGYTGLTFGDPIDWHLDPLRATRSPLVHWSQLDPLDPRSVGDSKVVWELNRHQWMVTLAQATLVTGDDRYARHAIRLLIDWIHENPVGRGINWASSLEVALRLIAWTWLLALLRHTTLFDDVAGEILASIGAHANHVERYLSHYYSPNTHLTGEALGLFYAGTLYPEFSHAARWRERGAATLVAQAERQISPDGVYFEQSTCYQRYSCDIYLHFLLLAARTDVAIPTHVRDRVEAMVDFLAAIADDEGVMPSIGDEDGGWLLPLCRRRADDCRGTLAVASVVFDRPQWGMFNSVEPDAVWLTGVIAPRAATIAPRRSQLFAGGGYAILRCRTHELIVDVGPLGCYGHGHADLLSIQCRIFGERCIVDPGTFGYTADPEWRDHFRGTAAHSTVTVDGMHQATASGPFGWRNRPRATIKGWQTTNDFDLIDAEHRAYPGVTHRRRVVLLKHEATFAIVDELDGEGVHHLDLAFQFAPIDVSLTGGTTAKAVTQTGRSLRLMSFSSAPLRAAIASGSVDPIRGWISPAYGQRTPAPALVYSTSTALPASIVTILHPGAGQHDAQPSIGALARRLRTVLNEPCAALPEY